LKLKAQEQFEHIAPIGFIQTTSKSKLKCKKTRHSRIQDEQDGIMKNNTKLK